MKPRFSALVGVVIVGLALGSSCANGPAVVTARPADLTVFFTSDTRGMLRRCGCTEGQMGGLSARASYLKSHRVEGRTLVLDAGDTLFGGMDYVEAKREFYTLKGRTIFKAMGEAGYDAASFGEYDFAFGWDLLYDTARVAGFPFVATNAAVDTGPLPVGPGGWYKSSVVKDVGGFKVGVIGVMDPAFPYASFERSFRGVSVSDPAGAAEGEISALKGNADLVIVLAHLSVSDLEGFVKGLRGADIVIQGHSQEMLEEPELINGALLVKGFNKGKHIGRLDLWLGRDGGRTVVRDYRYSVIAIDESIPPDPKVEEIIAGYRDTLKARKFVFQENDPEGAGHYVGPGSCKGCHADEYARWSETGHAKAFSALTKTNDQFDPECLPCHTTGYGWMSGYNALTGKYPDVTCESCHGPGSTHAPSDPLNTVGVTKAVDEKTCRGCHDEENSPNFEYERYKAMGGAHLGRQ